MLGTAHAGGTGGTECQDIRMVACLFLVDSVHFGYPFKVVLIVFKTVLEDFFPFVFFNLT